MSFNDLKLNNRIEVLDKNKWREAIIINIEYLNGYVLKV